MFECIVCYFALSTFALVCLVGVACLADSGTFT